MVSIFHSGSRGSEYFQVKMCVYHSFVRPGFSGWSLHDLQQIGKGLWTPKSLTIATIKSPSQIRLWNKEGFGARMEGTRLEFLSRTEHVHSGTLSLIHCASPHSPEHFTHSTAWWTLGFWIKTSVYPTHQNKLNFCIQQNAIPQISCQFFPSFPERKFTGASVWRLPT